MSLNSIHIGQEKARKILESFLKKEKIPATIIFSGPRGSGKSYFAYHFSEDIVCPEKDGIFACRKCSSCKLIESGVSPDFFVLENAEYESIKIEDIRKLQEFAAFKPVYGLKKVSIIEDAHLLTIEAFNSLLKTLEEPNIYTIIVLTTSKIDFIPKTVRSRAVIVPFLPYRENEIQEILLKNGINEDNVMFLAKISKGDVKKALNLIVQEFSKQRKSNIEFLIDFLDGDFKIPFLGDKSKALTLINSWQTFFEDVIRVRLSKNAEQVTNIDFRDEIISTASQFEIEELFQIEKFLINAEEDLTRININVKNYMNDLFFSIKENMLRKEPLPDEY